MERAELIRRHRFDRYTYVIVTNYVDKEEFEKRILNALKKKTVYDIAEEIKDSIRKYDLRADLMGTCKIHEEVPDHNRLTDDINIVVVREDFKYLDLLLRSYGFLYRGESKLLYADHIYLASKAKSVVLVAVDGIKHPTKNVRFYDLSPVLKAKKSIDLEHAVAGKLLMIPSIRRKTDGEDLAYAFAFGDIDLKKLVEILSKVIESYPEMAPIISRNLSEEEAYLREYAVLDSYSIEKIRYSLNYIAHNLKLETTIPESFQAHYSH